jgi:hypothetical protein
MAVLAALVAGLGGFAYQFKVRWTPLQRLYFPIYFQTAHVVSTRNRFLRPPQPFAVLTIVFPRETGLALENDVSPVPQEEGSPQTATFSLSQAAVQSGAERLEWRTVRLTDEQMHQWLAHWIYGHRSLGQLWRNAWYIALLVLAITLPLAIRRDTLDARKVRLGRVLKGVNFQTRSQFHLCAKHHTGIGWQTTNPVVLWERLFLKRSERTMVRVARQHECEHFLVVGDTGTGKSSLIRQLLTQIRDRREAAVVYDPAREYLPQFLDPARGDIILNPLDARMPYWGPSDELLHHTEADALAKSLFPDRDHENRFFVESPRKILAHLLKQHPTPQELCQWIARPDPEIDQRVAGTPLEALISKDAPQQRSGVLAVLERASSALSLLPSLSRPRHWTATKWVEGREGWVFLTTTPETRDTLRPLVSLWLDFLMLRLTAQTEPTPPAVWVILDELASLESLPTLPLALAESRKSNVRMVLGLQGRSQVEVRYGREAEAMLSQARTKVFLRTSEPRAAEWISKSIGDVEMEHLREGRTTGGLGFYYTNNSSVDSRIEAAILASEVSNLENLEGYFQTPGFTLRLTFPYLKPQKTHAAFIRSEVPEPTVSVKQEKQALTKTNTTTSDSDLNKRKRKVDKGDTQPLLENI